MRRRAVVVVISEEAARNRAVPPRRGMLWLWLLRCFCHSVNMTHEGRFRKSRNLKEGFRSFYSSHMFVVKRWNLSSVMKQSDAQRCISAYVEKFAGCYITTT